MNYLHKLEQIPFTYKQHTIRVYTCGKGNTLVFLHGFLGSSEVWFPFVNGLSKNYRILLLDLPGHGQSDNIGYVHTMEQIAELLDQLMTQLKIKKAVWIGHSMGGYVSLAFAELYPEKVKALVLMNSTAQADSEQKKEERLKAIAAVKQKPSLYTLALVNKLIAEHNHTHFPHELEMLNRVAAATSVKGIVASLTGMRERINREVILKFGPFPKLLIMGKFDLMLPLEVMLPQSTLDQTVESVIMERSGHMAFIEEPSSTLLVLKNFLKKHGW